MKQWTLKKYLLILHIYLKLLVMRMNALEPLTPINRPQSLSGPESGNNSFNRLI